MRARRLAAILFSLLFVTAAQAAERCTTVIVVRHAEQTDHEAQDPPLSEAGAARAKALAGALANAGVRAIYVTQYKRTRDTAAPLAEALKITPVEVPVERPKLAEYAPSLAKRILSEHPGGAVLVVGHSNTVPSLVEALTAVKIRAVERAEFDRLVVVTAGEPACARVVEAQYGPQ